MSVFIDTSFLVAYFNARDANHKRARQLIEGAVNGDYGKMFISDYIFDETITTALVRTKNHKETIKIGDYLLNSEVEALTVTKEVLLSAWEVFRKMPMSFTDCTTIAVMKAYGIKNIMTFDNEFKGVKSIEVVQ